MSNDPTTAQRIRKARKSVSRTRMALKGAESGLQTAETVSEAAAKHPVWLSFGLATLALAVLTLVLWKSE